MRASAILTAALFTLASALPAASQQCPNEQAIEVELAEYAQSQIGTGKVTLHCQKEPFHKTPCAGVLDSGNVLITARAVNAYADSKDYDMTPGLKDAFSFGYSGPRGAEKTYVEIRSYAYFKNLPEIARDKKCKFHFITDAGSNVVTQPVAKVWTLNGRVTEQTTWNDKPERADNVATFTVNDTTATILGKGRSSSAHKRDHKFIGGPGYMMQESFDCPTPGSDYVWEIAPDYDPKLISGDQSPLFTGGQNGLGLEVMDTPQTGYSF